MPELDRADRRRQRVVLAGVGLTRVTAGSVFGTAMAIYLGRQGSPFTVTLAYAIYSLGLVIFSPVWGAIADITGRRRAIMVGTALCSGLAILPLAMSVSVPLQIACRGAFAVFTAGFRSTILTVVSEGGGDAGRGRSIGFYNSSRAGGSISGRLLVGYLLGVLAPSELYLVVALGALVGTALTVLIVDPTPMPGEALTLDRLRDELHDRLLGWRSGDDLLAENGLGWLYLGMGLRNMTEKGFVSVVPVFLVSEVGLSEFVMGLVLAVSPGVRTVSMYAFGRLSDAIGRKDLIVAGLGGSGVQCLLAVAALLPAAASARIGLSASVFVVHALTFSALTAGTVAFIGDVAPVDRESELMGLRSTARGAGGVLGPLIVGAIATAFDYATAYVLISTLAFLAAALVWRKVVEPT